jgi:hypothetical protein
MDEDGWGVDDDESGRDDPSDEIGLFAGEQSSGGASKTDIECTHSVEGRPPDH